jgi:hypothetical protein
MGLLKAARCKKGGFYSQISIRSFNMFEILTLRILPENAPIRAFVRS